jgi:nitrogen fixation NifU-like protein
MYSPQVLDHFEHPRNAGELQDADARIRLENPACGDILELFVRVQHQRIADVRFRAKGCVPAMACGSAITGLMKGRSISEAAQISREEVAQSVGGLPPASGHAAQLAVDAAMAVLRKVSVHE